jgi:hypothetical protein
MNQSGRAALDQQTRGDRRLWLYAYVYVRRPSLTFLTLRPRQDAEPAIEDYLKTVRLR